MSVVDFKKRRYDAASKTTRTNNWRTPSTDANAAIVDPQTIRNRARDLVRNNPWAAKGVSVIVNNTIGYGIRCQFKKTALQKQWRDWAESTQCDAQGLTDFYGIQQLAVRAMVESGECLIRRRYRKTEDGLNVPVQLQVIEPDYLTTAKDGTLPNGGWITHGIEFDAIGRRVAYWLYKQHPGDSGFYYSRSTSDYSRVDAKDIIHLFRSDRPGQNRGVSWLAPVMIRLRELDIFEDAYLNRQKLANLFAAFVETDDPSEAEEEFTALEELMPGSIYVMRPGRKIDFSTPPQAADYGPYTLANLKAVAAGLGVTYEALTGDLSQVNFSSARMGWQEFGRSIDAWRWQLIIPRLCERVADWFIEAVPGMDQQPRDWTPPARTIVDPAREIPAIKDAIRTGLMTLPEAMREQGYDPQNMLKEIAEFNAAMDAAGVVLDSDPRQTSAAGTTQNTVTPNDNANTTNP